MIYFLDARLVLNDDDVFQVRLSSGSQLVDPLGSARIEPDCEDVRVGSAVELDVVAVPVAVEALQKKWRFMRQ